MGDENATGAIPLRIVRHYPQYLDWIRGKMASGADHVSAAELAAACGFDPVVTRKELAATGVIGVPRRGFPAKELSRAMVSLLGWDNATDAVLVGAGSLGTALLGYGGFKSRNFNFVAAFDSDPEKTGRRLHGVEVFDVSRMERLVRRLKVRLAVLTVPKSAAQGCADALAAAGVRGIWNFAPANLSVPDGVHVENADLVAGLAALSHAIASA